MNIKNGSENLGQKVYHLYILSYIIAFMFMFLRIYLIYLFDQFMNFRYITTIEIFYSLAQGVQRRIEQKYIKES